MTDPLCPYLGNDSRFARSFKAFAYGRLIDNTVEQIQGAPSPSSVVIWSDFLSLSVPVTEITWLVTGGVGLAKSISNSACTLIAESCCLGPTWTCSLFRVQFDTACTLCSKKGGCMLGDAFLSVFLPPILVFHTNDVPSVHVGGTAVWNGPFVELFILALKWFLSVLKGSAVGGYYRDSPWTMKFLRD